MNTRTLGTIAMICSPALLIEALSFGAFGENSMVIGIASFIFMAGWLCSNLAMQQMQAAGTGPWGRWVLRIQMVGIFLAMLFGLFEATAILPEDNLIFIITDMCWPLSMVFMIVVGIMVIRANRWAGWQRYIPLICALWLPVAIVIGLPAESNPAFEQASALIGFAWAGVAWFVLGLIVRSNATLVAPQAGATPEAVVNAG